VFARLVSFQWQRSRLDEAIRAYRENVAPARKAKKGSRGGYFLVDRKTGKGVVITLWDSERDILATEESGFFKEQLAKFQEFLTAPPVREIYEVGAQD